jgi:hypothetical protein
MTAAEILAKAQARGVEVGLTPAGDGLRIWSEGDPQADLVELLKCAKPQIIEALRRERARINFWIAARITNTPRNFCLNCRKPILPGQRVVPVASGGALAHFHEPCHGAWLVEQEGLARKAMGLAQKTITP